MKVKTLLVAILFLSSFSVYADSALTQQDLLGTWRIEKESVNADGNNAKASNSVWSFRADGTIEGIAEDNDKNARISQMRAILKYSVENGKLIKQSAPGRSKMEACSAVEKEGNKLVLKCESIYFFMQKN